MYTPGMTTAISKTRALNVGRSVGTGVSVGALVAVAVNIGVSDGVEVGAGVSVGVSDGSTIKVGMIVRSLFGWARIRTKAAAHAVRQSAASTGSSRRAALGFSRRMLSLRGWFTLISA
jgi:hypothetical protein